MAANQAVSGVTPTQFVTAFEGAHTSTLTWETPEPGPEDELTLELRPRASLDAWRDCSGVLDVGVTVTVTTSAHGELESFDTRLRGPVGQLESATLHHLGLRVALDAELVVVEGEVRVSGNLTTDDAALPAANATFPAPEGGGGTGGGG